ncbi:MAG TPA: hypothetical protein VMI55_01980 [Thermoplasmata archaeon]|nr:hypothetical protein [Thermoplasmata archaeon]
MACPACGTELPADAPVCPKCQLSGSLFQAVREAAGPGETDPVSLRTIGELLATVDLSKPATPAPESPTLLSRARFPPPPEREVAPPPPEVTPTPAPAPIQEFPELPPVPTDVELERRLEEYVALGRRMGLDFGRFEERNNEARLTQDRESLESLAREMFVHLISALAEEFESALARRNELAAFCPTATVDVELDAARQAIARRDLSGALRRLAHVRDELQRSEEEWAVGRILVTEGDLLAGTIRELGGDPAPALGPFDEGRRLVRAGRRSDGERLLARGAIALWAVLEPRLIEDLRRLRDRLVEIRAAGGDIETPVQELRSVLAELRQRNFVGSIVAYRRVRSFVDQMSPPGEVPDPSGELVGTLRPSPSL